MNLYAVIMAGGSGTRLWPLSRSAYPKQFLALHDEDTMFQATFKRLAGLDIKESITICNEEHRFLVAEQLRKIDKLGSIILEPVGRNTAPAIALAALTVENDPLLLVLSADHVIKDQAAFNEAIMSAIPLAEEGKLVAFGVIPTKPHEGYGYIRRGKEFGVGFEVNSFVEKPNSEVAQEYFLSGEYYWNSGMFLFRASSYIQELEKFRPDILKQCKASIMEAKTDLNFFQINKEKFESCPAESIDYAVMENTEHAVVVPINVGWSDVGSWSSLWDISKKDSGGNFSHGDVLLHNTHNSYVRTDDKFLAVIGVDNMVIVSTKDALLVANKDEVQDVKIITESLKAQARSEWHLGREVHRPWGKYDSIDWDRGFQVKRITVKPGAKLSVQMHNHRSEHWVVVSGTAIVTNGNHTFSLSENESTYIPVGVIHSLENPGPDELKIIEVQSGAYLGEDDIVRFEDKYGRLEK